MAAFIKTVADVVDCLLLDIPDVYIRAFNSIRIQRNPIQSDGRAAGRPAGWNSAPESESFNQQQYRSTPFDWNSINQPINPPSPDSIVNESVSDCKWCVYLLLLFLLLILLLLLLLLLNSAIDGCVGFESAWNRIYIGYERGSTSWIRDLCRVITSRAIHQSVRLLRSAILKPESKQKFPTTSAKIISSSPWQPSILVSVSIYKSNCYKK